jgi:hypothetical protein
MVSIVRGQIADPHMANKARAGRAEDVRPCISCNQMCWGRRSRDYWISCLVNPSVGREYQWGGDRFAPAAMSKHVLVVGGGPAGLEVARVAAGAIASRWSGNGASGWAVPAGGDNRAAVRHRSPELVRGATAQAAGSGEATPVDADEVRARAPMPSCRRRFAAGGTGYQRGLPTRDRMPGLERGNVWSVEEVMGSGAPGRACCSSTTAATGVAAAPPGTWRSRATPSRC